MSVSSAARPNNPAIQLPWPAADTLTQAGLNASPLVLMRTRKGTAHEDAIPGAFVMRKPLWQPGDSFEIVS